MNGCDKNLQHVDYAASVKRETQRKVYTFGIQYLYFLRKASLASMAATLDIFFQCKLFSVKYFKMYLSLKVVKDIKKN